MPLASAIASTIKEIFAGSFTVPLNGCGDRYGQSVSTTNLSSGISAATSLVLLQSLSAFIFLKTQILILN